MRATEELAHRLVDFDDELARGVLGEICRQLGGPTADDGVVDVHRSHAFLTRMDVQGKLVAMSEVGDAPHVTTQEWKREFAHHERLRGLGLLIAELLS